MYNLEKRRRKERKVGKSLVSLSFSLYASYRLQVRRNVLIKLTYSTGQETTMCSQMLKWSATNGVCTRQGDSLLLQTPHPNPSLMRLDNICEFEEAYTGHKNSKFNWLGIAVQGSSLRRANQCGIWWSARWRCTCARLCTVFSNSSISSHQRGASQAESFT